MDKHELLPLLLMEIGVLIGLLIHWINYDKPHKFKKKDKVKPTC